MATNHIMYHQGRGKEFSLPNCGSGPEFTCPTSKRIAAEYHRSFFTLTNVLNPNWDNAYYGRETWQQKFLDNVEVGDTIWFVYVPPKHNLYDVAAYAEKTLADGSSLTSLAGMELELVTGDVEVTLGDKENVTSCDPTNVQSHGTLTFPAGTDPEEIFVQAKIEKLTTPKTGIVVGLKINKAPTDKDNLKDIRSKIAVVAHVLGYDAQTHQ